MSEPINENSENKPLALTSTDGPKRETREQVLERLLRELVWHAENVRTIILRDRQNMDFDYAADLLDTAHIHDVITRKRREE